MTLTNLILFIILLIFIVKSKKSKVKSKNVVTFIHVPKTGGMYVKNRIEKSIKQNMYSNFEIKLTDHKRSKDISGVKFAVIRNPYERFLSAFNYLIEGGKVFPGKQHTNDIQFMHKLKELRITRPIDIFNSKEKQELLNYIHFKPMTYYLCNSNDHVCTDYILHHEKIDKELQTFFQVELNAQCPISVPSVNESNKIIKYLTEEEKEQIWKYYQKDFRIFGYNLIPKIIHQTWKHDDVSTYADGIIGKKSQHMWKSVYNDYTYKLWTDDEFIELLNKINNQEWKKTYTALNEKIKKIDFMRYVILYTFGGIYADLDFIPNARIPPKIIDSYKFITYKASRPKHTKKYVMGQAFFACMKNYIGLKEIIDNICTEKHSIKNPLLHTGPEKVDKILNKKHYLNYIYIFDFDEVSDTTSYSQKGKYGYHYRKHQW